MKPDRVYIDRRGFLHWDWEVRIGGFGHESGTTRTRWGAVREAKRAYRGTDPSPELVLELDGIFPQFSRKVAERGLRAHERSVREQA